jgi:hypothetical protein
MQSHPPAALQKNLQSSQPEGCSGFKFFCALHLGNFASKHGDSHLQIIFLMIGVKL